MTHTHPLYITDQNMEHLDSILLLAVKNLDLWK